MKLIAAMALVFFLAKGCGNETAKDMQTAQIEYTANTRGFFQKLTVNNGVFSKSEDRNSDAKAEASTLTKEQTQDLVAAFQEISLEDLNDYKAPTEKRFYDGAAIGKLKIIYQGKTYESAEFDHGNPPVEIEKFVDMLQSLAKTE